MNQAAAPRPDLEAPAEIRYTICHNPCIGGEGCGGYEVHWETYCRTTGSYSKDCTPASGRYCARSVAQDIIDASTGTNLVTCVTCLY